VLPDIARGVAESGASNQMQSARAANKNLRKMAKLEKKSWLIAPPQIWGFLQKAPLSVLAQKLSKRRQKMFGMRIENRSVIDD
jgi:hypothetical protein